jgi:GH18 family chitinase
LFAGADTPPRCNSTVTVAGYFNSWSSYTTGAAGLQPEDIDPTLYTHPIYAFVTFSPTTFAVDYADPKLDSVLIPRFITAMTAGNPCNKPLVSVANTALVGSVSVWSLMTSSVSNRAAFISSLITFCRNHNFAGAVLVRGQSR